MKQKLTQFLDATMMLPPVYYYAGLAIACIGLFALSWVGKDSDPGNGAGVKVNVAFETSPQPRSQISDLYGDVRREAGESASQLVQLNPVVSNLEKQIVSVVNGIPSGDTVTLDETFSAKGIDREKFQRRFSDAPIAVQRWQTSESAPELNGDAAFEMFVESALAPWIGTADFRIKLSIYASELADNVLSADLVAESFGKTESDQGLQATSIWNSTWTIEGSSLKLASIRVVAQEEVAVNVHGGHLLIDCTESVFQRCDTLKDQLVFGLDQWARRIPGIDIVGNHGIAVGDINQDGLDDLYICQPHGLPNRLLIQNPDGTVEDISKSSNLDILDESHGALIIDVDNDHDQDLIVSTDESLVLLSNRGDGTFQLEHSLAIGRNAHSVIAADYDQDGDLDLYLCKYQDVNRQSDVLMFPAKIENADDGGRNVLLRNDEGWNFHDATEECGITTNNRSYTRSAIWIDFDLDGDLDLYVANEFTADQLYENQDGWFSDVSEKRGINVPARHRSVSVGEFNRDGRLDLFVATDVPLAAFRQLKNSNSGANSEEMRQVKETMIGENQIWFGTPAGEKLSPFFLRAPIFSSESAFGSATADLNNDGLDDVIVSNGFISRLGEDVADSVYAKAFSSSTAVNSASDDPLMIRMAQTAHQASDLARQGYSLSANQRNRCYLSIGQLGFANISALSGFDFPDDARGIATTDWDGDGDTDVVMTCRNGPQIRVLCNQLQSDNQHVHFDLKGTVSNVDAIGSRVELFLRGSSIPLVKSLTAGSGSLSQSSKRIMFGMGKNQSIEKAVVIWPNGDSQSYTGLEPNRRYEITEGNPNAAEKTNERFNLAIGPRKINEPTNLPAGSIRSIFYPRPVISELQFQSQPDKWFNVEIVDDQPALVVFCSPNGNSEKLLQDISDASERFATNKLSCTALMVDAESSDDSQTLIYTQKIVSDLKFPFTIGSASKSTVDKLQYQLGDWFSNQQLPEFPIAILLDSSGKVAAYYSGDAVNTDQIFNDFGIALQPDWQYRIAAAPLGGRWTSRYRFAKLNRLRTRLKEVGYADDADAMFDSTIDQRAFELCQKAIELDSQGDSDRSTQLFNQAIKMDPNCVMAYVGEGNLLRRLAKEQKPENGEIKVRMQHSAAADFEHAIRLDPLNTEAIIGLANIAMDQKRIDEALLKLMEYVEVDPTKYEVHAIIGRLLFHQRKHTEAAEFLLTAFENRPSLPFVAGDLGFLYLRAGEYEQANKFLRSAHRLQPSDKNILRLLAESEFVTGQFDEAVRLFEKVAQADPNRRRSKNVLAWLLATSPYENQRDGEQAMRLINPMVELFGDTSASTLEIYAACFAENGNFDQALKFQQQAVDLVDSGKSTDRYSEEQIQGLRSRLELYRRQLPYRTANVMQIPIQAPGQKK